MLHLGLRGSFFPDVYQVHVGMQIKVKLLKEKRWKEERKIFLASPDS